MKEKRLFTKRDIILTVILLAAAGVLYAGMKFFSSDGRYAVVYENQEEIARYDLAKNASYEIRTEYGVNTLVIKDGTASVTEADCPDSICVHTGEISKTGETIVCLPHKLVIQIEE